MTDRELSIVIPAWNEARRIGDTLSRYLGYFEGKGCEIIVVLDGCTDDTRSVVSGFSGRSGLRVIDLPLRLGKGGAVINGLLAAGKEYAGYVDSDGSMAPEDFFSLFSQMGEADAVIASRYIEGAVIGRRQPFNRRLAGRLFNLCARILFGLPYSDTQCGAKIFRRGMLAEILPKVQSSDWIFDVEILLRAGAAGGKIKELPARWSDTAGSTFDILSNVPSTLASIARLFRMGLREELAGGAAGK